jgi:hypothetical protein
MRGIHRMEEQHMEIAILAAILVGWFVVNKWVLPRAGIGT